MAFANLYWNCIDQQLKDTELEDEREELSSIHIPKSHASPVFNNAKLSFLTFLTSMFESKVLYASPSNRTLPKTPRDFYMPNYEDLEIITKDKKVVHGWLIKRKDSRNVPTIIHFHGNACNVSHMLYDALGMFQKVKTNIMLVDYRGYGLSEGSPTQAGLIMDAEAALDYLLRRRDVVDPTSIFLFGRSLGGAVAIELAARRESAVRAVMVENTFTSIDDLVKHLSPAYSKHVIRAMSNKWNSQQVIPSISRPMLFLSGRADEIVPPWMMTSLYKAAVRSEGRELAAFPKGKHNSTCLSRGYYETIKRFVDRVLVPGMEDGGVAELEAGEAAR
mmetsp:Transcript_27108/g.64006  ORF Transcript_27108/g.64006 Transcript_27108/m.64006 type:complete len:333 (-) Transcript_27108:349-1347(-)